MACSMEILEFVETCETMERLPNEIIMRIIRESTQIKNSELQAERQAVLLPLVEEFSEKVKEFQEDLDLEPVEEGGREGDFNFTERFMEFHFSESCSCGVCVACRCY